MGDPTQAIRNISRLEEYVAFYLHQDFEKIATWTWEELSSRFHGAVDIVRAQNGKPPLGEYDENQTFT